MNDLWHSIDADCKALSTTVAGMRREMVDAAKAEDAYRRIKARALLDNKKSGIPATISRDAVFDRDDVADARLARDIAQAFVDSDKECVNALKLSIRIANDQLQREWTQAGNRRD